MEKGKQMDYREKDLQKIVKNNRNELRPLFSNFGTDSYRVYDRNIADLPITIDMYGNAALINDYREDEQASPTPEKLRALAASSLYLPEDRINYIHRKKKDEDLFKGTEQSLIIKENFLRFHVELGKRLDTGLFLDHAVTRTLIQSESQQRDVLNLFCYTGSFSVYAAAGRAQRVVSVDLSSNYLSWAKKNMELNKFFGKRYEYVQQDCKTYLEEAIRRKEQFDLIILDPPSFSNSRKMENTFTIQRDHVDFLKQCCTLLKPGGAVVFSTNLTEFKLDAKLNQRFFVKSITKETIPPGFSSKKPVHYCWILFKK